MSILSKGKAENRKRSLSYRELKFVEVFKGNATEAAIAAGYKPSSARIIGCRLLRKPEIRELLDRKMAQVAKQAGVERVDIVQRLWELASLSHAETGGGITGQVRAADTLAEIMGMKVQRTADLTKQFDGRSEEELEFYANNGRWPESMDGSGSDASAAQGLRALASKSPKVN